MIHPTRREIHSESCETKTNLNCNHTFQIAPASISLEFVAKLIEKVQLQSKFG